MIDWIIRFEVAGTLCYYITIQIGQKQARNWIMKVLLVWDVVGEGCKFFAIDSPTQEQLTVLGTANGKIINYDMEEHEQIACDKLNQALSKPEHLPEPDDDMNILYKEFASIWVDNEINVENLPNLKNGPFGMVYYSGFAL